MYLKHIPTGELMEVADLMALVDPFQGQVPMRSHAGEELGEPEPVAKGELAFPSGEALPRCWTDPHYKD